MTDRELLAQLKKSYEYLYDIRENGCNDHCVGQLEYDNIKRLDYVLKEIDNIYSTFYKTLDLEDLIVPKKIFDNIITIGSYVDRDYDIYTKDNFVMGNDIDIISCGDLDYCWYNDKKFINE